MVLDFVLDCRVRWMNLRSMTRPGRLPNWREKSDRFILTVSMSAFSSEKALSCSIVFASSSLWMFCGCEDRGSYRNLCDFLLAGGVFSLESVTAEK